MVYIVFSGFGLILLLVAIYQHKIFNVLKRDNIGFLRELTDGNIDKGTRGNPFKVIPYVLGKHEVDNSEIRSYKLRIKLLLFLIPIAVVAIIIVNLILGS